MHEEWNVDATLARQLIESQFSWDVHSLEEVSLNRDDKAYLVNGQWVFRFPLRQLRREEMKSELEFLPQLQSHLSFDVAQPQWVGKPTDHFPSMFIGSPWISGVVAKDINPLVEKRLLAISLAKKLRELHEVSWNQLVNSKSLSLVKAPNFDWKNNTTRLKDEAREVLHSHGQQLEALGLSTSVLREILEGFSFRGPFTQDVIVHGELDWRHLILQENSQDVCAIIQWKEIHPGPRGWDLAAAWMMFDESEQKVFFETYGSVSESDFELSLFRALCYPLLLFPQALIQSDENHLVWTLSALQRALWA